MDEEKLTNEPEAQSSERREFITKMVTAAGAVAVAGLVANDASADMVKLAPTEVKLHKLRNGFRMKLSGRQIGEAMKQIGLQIDEASLENAALTIEFSA